MKSKAYCSLLFSVFMLFFTTVISDKMIATESLRGTLELEWLQHREGPVYPLQECKRVFLDAFLDAYQNVSCQELGVEDKVTFLEEAFASVHQEFECNRSNVCLARVNGKVVGIMSVSLSEENSIYLSQLAVHPSYQRCGIGSRLVTSILQKFPDRNTIYLVIRLCNSKGRAFYEKFGFRLSPYMHVGYTPARYVGYEFQRKK